MKPLISGAGPIGWRCAYTRRARACRGQEGGDRKKRVPAAGATGYLGGLVARGLEARGSFVRARDRGDAAGEATGTASDDRVP